MHLARHHHRSPTGADSVNSTLTLVQKLDLVWNDVLTSLRTKEGTGVEFHRSVVRPKNINSCPTVGSDLWRAEPGSGTDPRSLKIRLGMGGLSGMKMIFGHRDLAYEKLLFSCHFPPRQGGVGRAFPIDWAGVLGASHIIDPRTW